MKTNEAPEKIWVHELSAKELNVPLKEYHIEYTRTDSFIERACSWLRTHSEADYFELIPDANYCGAGNINKKRMIDEFRKYMKGEEVWKMKKQ